MARVKGGVKQRRKHNKIKKLAQGFRGTRHRLISRAAVAVERSFEHAFAGRKQKRRDLRRLWIVRIGSALTQYDVKYSRFINGLEKSGLELNRKMLSEMAINDPKAFGEIVTKVKTYIK